MEGEELVAYQLAVRAIVLFGLLSGVIIGSPNSAVANPSLAETERMVQQLEREMVVAAEEYHAAKSQLDGVQQRLDELRPAYDAMTTDVAARQLAVDELAVAAYQSGGIDPMTVLMAAGTPETALEQLGWLNLLHSQRRDRVDELAESHRQLSEQKDEIEAQYRELSDKEQVASDNQTKVQQDLAKWEKLRDQLGGRTGRLDRASMRSYAGQGIGLAAVAVRFAYDQQSKPYEFAAAGPSSFDCSGLTKAAWARAGVSMPHSAREQFAAFPQVPLDELQPGDLVFYGDPIYHVAMYVGNGDVIHAPEPGDVVRIAPMDKAGGTPIGAVRPG